MGCRGDTRELEFTKKVIVLGACTLTLVHLDKHTRLVVRVSGEHLRLLGRYSGITFDEGSHNTAGGLNTE